MSTPKAWVEYAARTLERERRPNPRAFTDAWERAEWMSDQEWAEAQEWDRSIRQLYGVELWIEP